MLIVKNITREGPGILELILKEREIPYTIVDLSKEDVFSSPKGYGAVVVLGGPDSANDTTAKMRGELKKVEEIIALGLPYLGICLGLQVLVKAAGGSVVKSSTKEVGFRDPKGALFTISFTDKGGKDPLFYGIESTFNVFHLHGETVELAEGMEFLGIGAYCRNQIVRVGKNAYGIQCHVELTTEMLTLWLDEDPDLKQLERQRLEEDFFAIGEAYTKTGRQIFQNFLKIVGY